MTEFARACQDTREHTALLRGTAPTRVACLEWQRERNATAITTDRAVEEPSSTAFLCRYRKATPYNPSLQLLDYAEMLKVYISHCVRE